MLLEQTIDKLYQMRLSGMADAIREQMASAQASQLSFDERIGLIVDRQWDLRETRGLARRLQVARLRQQAAVEDIDFHSHRGLDKAALLSLAECNFIKAHSNIIITGPTGVGKPISPLRSPTRRVAEIHRQVLQVRDTAVLHKHCQSGRELPVPHAQA